MKLTDEQRVNWPGTVCAECGDDFPEIDCATELCEMCFEHIMGPDAEGFEP